MLNKVGVSAIGSTMSFGCAIKVFPYEWDSANFQLKLPSSTWHLLLYNLHRATMFILWIVLSGRFFRRFNTAEDFPEIRVLHLVWILGYTLTIVCYVQLHLKHTEILQYANSLFANISNSNLAKDMSKWYECTKLTGCVLTSTFLLFLNPPCHAAAVLRMPCAPNFISSLVFTCNHTMDNIPNFFEKLPWIIAENMVVTNFLFAWSFNWIMIFLGNAWIRRDLRLLVSMGTESGDMELSDMTLGYRRLQTRMKGLNDCFQYYLAWFPIVILRIVALLFFGSIRLFWTVPFLTYVNFPTCALRCLFESMTPLSISSEFREF